MGILPSALQFPESEAHAAGGEIGSAGRLYDHESTQLDDEREAIGASDGIPANPCVTVFEPHGGTAPTEHGDELIKAGKIVKAGKASVKRANAAKK